MEVLLDALLVVGGAVLVGAVLDSALRTFVLPRGVVSRLTRTVFVSVRGCFELVAKRLPTYEGRDRVMAVFAPAGLLALVAVWIVMVVVGYALAFRAVVDSWAQAFELSGSSFFTLGFAVPPRGVGYLLTFSEAAAGVALLALLIAYLPTIYASFSRRELAVARLATRAGTPPSGVELLERFHAIDWLDRLPDLWADWEAWFAELAETHTTFAVLPFFRSPNPHRSWVTSAGAVLDAAALAQSTVAVPWSPQAGLCIRAGFLALRELADLFGIPYPADPAPGDPISISREEFDAARERLAASGVALRPDREQAWRDFAGWRVNYDAVLVALSGLTMAPYAPWSSDRSIRYRRPPVLRRRPPG